MIKIFDLIAKPGNSWSDDQIIDFVKNNPGKDWGFICFALKRSEKEIKKILIRGSK